jgi:hypothetical protein
MLPMVRNLTDAVDGFLLSKRYLVMDRDPGMVACVLHFGSISWSIPATYTPLPTTHPHRGMATR